MLIVINISRNYHKNGGITYTFGIYIMARKVLSYVVPCKLKVSNLARRPCVMCISYIYPHNLSFFYQFGPRGVVYLSGPYYARGAGSINLISA